MKKTALAKLMALGISLLLLANCSSQQPAPAGSQEAAPQSSAPASPQSSEESNRPDAPDDFKQVGATQASSATFGSGLVLSDYQPKKDSYKFYYTYKCVHAWYDPIKLGLEDAARQYGERGIDVEFEYTAPTLPDAVDQITRIEEAAGRGFDVIGVDVSDVRLLVEPMNQVIDMGVPIFTFASGDVYADSGSKRLAFIGCYENELDGYTLAKYLAEGIGGKGKVACLAGTIGAPQHEQIMDGFNACMKEYPDIEVVDIQYDNDEMEKSIQYAENFIQRFPDLDAIFCNNMTSPVGAGQAVEAAGKRGEIQIYGWDHDLQALEYLERGTIQCLAIMDGYLCGFNMIEMSVMIADGLQPGEDTYPEIRHVTTEFVFQDRAREFIDTIYPDA